MAMAKKPGAAVVAQQRAQRLFLEMVASTSSWEHAAAGFHDAATEVDVAAAAFAAVESLQ
jgi:hypothetical protein